MFKVNKKSKSIKIVNTYVVMLLFCVPLFFSCVKDDEKLTFSGQEEAIEKYVKALENRYEVYPEGVWRVIYEEGDGNTLVEYGSQVRIIFTISQFIPVGFVQIFTNKESSGGEGDWVIVGNNSILRGLDIGIIGASLNERCDLLFSARHGFGNIQVGIVPKMTPLSIEVIIKEIKNN
jgi:hypothetical protein